MAINTDKLPQLIEYIGKEPVPVGILSVGGVYTRKPGIAGGLPAKYKGGPIIMFPGMKFELDSARRHYHELDKVLIGISIAVEAFELHKKVILHDRSGKIVVIAQIQELFKALTATE